MAANRSSRRLPNELFWETAKWARLEHYERNLLENGAARLLVGAAFGVYLRQHCHKLKLANNKMAQPMQAKCRHCNAFVNIVDQMNHFHQCTARQALLNANFTLETPIDSLDEATSTAALGRRRGAETESGAGVSEPPPNKKFKPEESSDNLTSTGTQNREEEEESIATSPPTESDPPSVSTLHSMHGLQPGGLDDLFVEHAQNPAIFGVVLGDDIQPSSGSSSDSNAADDGKENEDPRQS